MICQKHFFVVTNLRVGLDFSSHIWAQIFLPHPGSDFVYDQIFLPHPGSDFVYDQTNLSPHVEGEKK